MAPSRSTLTQPVMDPDACVRDNCCTLPVPWQLGWLGGHCFYASCERVRSVVDYGLPTLNIISCPSCSRVENEAFVELAQQVREMTTYARDHAITIAVMGCRVNGPGETDDADLGLWCGPNYVNLKRGSTDLGAYAYDKILDSLKQQLDQLIAERSAALA